MDVVKKVTKEIITRDRDSRTSVFYHLGANIPAMGHVSSHSTTYWLRSHLPCLQHNVPYSVFTRSCCFSLHIDNFTAVLLPYEVVFCYYVSPCGVYMLLWPPAVSLQGRCYIFDLQTCSS